MRRLIDPVFREGIQVYLEEGQGFMVYFFYLVILAILQFLMLIFPAADAKVWLGPAHLFRFSSVVALILVIYFGLRLANQEFAPWKFQPLKHWFQQGRGGVLALALSQIGLLALHAIIFILISFPLLGWAGAIARTPIRSILFTLLLLFCYSLTYGIWGLVGLVFWERKVDSRRVFVRWLFVCLILLSGLVYLPLNPVAFLLFQLGGVDLGGPLQLWGWRWSPPVVHTLFQIFLLMLGLLLYGWALKRLKESD